LGKGSYDTVFSVIVISFLPSLILNFLSIIPDFAIIVSDHPLKLSGNLTKTLVDIICSSFLTVMLVVLYYRLKEKTESARESKNVTAITEGKKVETRTKIHRQAIWALVLGIISVLFSRFLLSGILSRAIVRVITSEGYRTFAEHYFGEQWHYSDLVFKLPFVPSLCGCIFALCAIIYGYKARSKIKAERDKWSGNELASVGSLLGIFTLICNLWDVIHLIRW
jgi:membrane protein implicated in regulation of membrane protease activity